jgi:cell wall-associated NlpC family hydrolase
MFKLKTLMLSSAMLLLLVLLPCSAYAYNGTGIVKCSDYLNLRQSPSTSATILDKLNPETKISIEDSSNGWYKTTYNGKSGWVSSDYVSTQSLFVPILSSRGDSDIAQKIADYAQKFVGVRYVYGGESPKGFDCSGLTQYVFSNFGIKLNRTASSQTSQGTVIKESDLKMGDLVFFDTDGGHNSITHVGIYLGNDKFIHAESGSVRSVSVSDLGESYYARNFMTARRIIN